MWRKKTKLNTIRFISLNKDYSSFFFAKTRLFKFAVVMVLIVTLFIKNTQSVEAFAGGVGTVADPYQITTPAELANVGSYTGSGNSNKYFKLMNDIDLNIAPYNTGTGWTPIGNQSNKFYGKFDGNFKNIDNLFINNSSSSYQGLFGYIASGSNVSNITLTDANVSGALGVGALVGNNDSGATVSKAGVTGGIVEGTQRVGGLIGGNRGAISQSYSKNTVKFTPGVSPTCCTGGLVSEAFQTGATITNSYSRSNIIVTVYSAYNQGALGGFTGNSYSNGTVTNNYSTGSITVPNPVPANVGGFMGSQVSANFSNNYWDTESSGRLSSDNGSASTGKTTAQMKTQSTYSSWDFGSIWTIDGSGSYNNGYPYLQWESPSPNPTVSSLGDISHTNGSWSSDNTPTLSFTTADPNVGDTVKHQIQIDNNNDFSSPEVDYTSDLTTPGASSFTVGQAPSVMIMGNYNTGSQGQTLADGQYYWRVKAIDSSNHESTYTVANSGSVAFKIDTTAPSAPGTPTTTTPTSDTTPTINWTASADSGSGLASTAYTVLRDTHSDFSTATSTTSTTNSYTFNTLPAGIYYIRILSTDAVGNISANSGTLQFTIDLSVPTINSLNPADNATGVPIAQNLSITFNENIVKNSGNIVIYKQSDDSIVETIPVNSVQVAINGSTVTINPTANLVTETNYYIQIDSGSFTDIVSNSFTGISNKTDWTFTAVDAPAVFCQQPISTATSISGNCEIQPAGAWGVESWEARYKKLTDTSYTNLTLTNSTQANTTVNNLTPDTDYYLEFRFTNDYGIGSWSRLVITTASVPPIVTTPTPKPDPAPSSTIITKPQDTSTNRSNKISPSYTTTQLQNKDLANTNNTSEKITLNNFSEYRDSVGKILSLKPGQIIYFYVGTELHTVTINNITGSSVNFTVASTPKNITLTTNNSQELDINNDGQADIKISLDNTQNNLATMNFKAIQISADSTQTDNTSTTKTKSKNPNNHIIWWIIFSLTILILLIAINKSKKNKPKPTTQK